MAEMACEMGLIAMQWHALGGVGGNSPGQIFMWAWEHPRLMKIDFFPLLSLSQSPR